MTKRKKKKKKRNRKGKEDCRENATGREKRYLLLCYCLLHDYAGTMVERTRIQSQPLRDFCLLVIIPRYRLLPALPAALIAGKNNPTQTYIILLQMD